MADTLQERITQRIKLSRTTNLSSDGIAKLILADYEIAEALDLLEKKRQGELLEAENLTKAVKALDMMLHGDFSRGRTLGWEALSAITREEK